MLKSLHDLGYHVEYRLLNTSKFSVPQNRVRI
ncbi:DNA cytosine methyltransferase, partial [Salmonella enterica subsp. enterica serovar Derby]|nr:DNA cytosine methyltransferase [Salmonella enterica subsp. enterica serovar Derby]